MSRSICTAAAVFSILCCVSAPSFARQTTKATPTHNPARTKKAHPTKAVAAKAAPLVYECPDCQEKFTAAQAKKAEMKCSCCKVNLVAIKPAPAAKASAKKS